MGYLHRWLAHDRFEAAREDQRIMWEIEARGRPPTPKLPRRGHGPAPLRSTGWLTPRGGRPGGVSSGTRGTYKGPYKANLRIRSE